MLWGKLQEKLFFKILNLFHQLKIPHLISNKCEDLPHFPIDFHVQLWKSQDTSDIFPTKTGVPFNHFVYP